MSRNGSGVYTVVNTFVSGNPVTAAGHNQNWSDIASEITNSVAADGQTSMTGPLKATSGTVGAPGLTFASDPDSGLYRIGSNNLGVAVNGAKVIDVATTGASVTGTLAATGAISQGGFALLPAGVIFPYGGTSAPAGYLLCFGQSLLRADYAALFTAIGTTYGAADGTHFNLPDLRGRSVAGKDDMGGSSANRLTGLTDGVNGDTLGAAGGLETQTLGLTQLPTGITSTNSGAIALSVTSTEKLVGGPNTGSATAGGTQVTANAAASGALHQQMASTGNIAIGAADVTSDNTSGAAHNNVQPTFILNYIIFAGI